MGMALFLLVAIVAGTMASVMVFRGHFDGHPLFVGILGVYAVIYGLVPAVAPPVDVPDSIYIEAGVTSLLGLAGLIVGWNFVRTKSKIRPRTLVPRDDTGWLLRAVLLFTALGVFGFVLNTVSAAGSVNAYLEGGRFAFRGTGNPLLVIGGESLMRSLLVVPFLLTQSTDRRLRLLGYMYAFVGALLVYVAFNGTRAIALGLVGAAGFGHLWLHVVTGRPLTRREGVMRAFRFAGLALAIGILAMGLYNAREAMNTRGVSALATEFGDFTDAGSVVGSEPLGYSRFLFVAVEHVPESRDFMWIYPVRRTLFFFLPSGGLKPPDLNIEFARLIPGFPPGGTVPPSLPGEGYIALGGAPGAFFWLVLYGLLGAWMERSASRSRVAQIAFGGIYVELLLLASRGQLYEDVVRVVTLLVSVWIVCFVLGRAKAVRHEAGSPRCRKVHRKGPRHPEIRRFPRPASQEASGASSGSCSL